MVDVVDVPSLVAGQWMDSDKTIIVKDFQGQERVRIHGTSDSYVRVAKRSALQIREQLAATPLPVLFAIVQSASDHYFSDSKDYDMVARLAGSPISFIYESTEMIRNWLTNTKDYVANAFGSSNYEHVPIVANNKKAGYRRFVPTSIAAVVVPQNDEGVSVYVIAQLFLAKTPVIVKPSARGASAFATMKFIKALHKAIRLVAPDMIYLLKAVQMVNVLDRDDISREQQVANLGVDGANFIVFGSNKSIDTLDHAIRAKLTPRKIIKLGDGFTVSLILPDADLALAVNEVHDSVISDRGNKCNTTHVLYVHEKVYDDVKLALIRFSQLAHVDNLLDTRARTGTLDAATQTKVAKRLEELNHRCDELSRPGLSFFEVAAHEHVEEIPGALLFVKKIDSLDHFFEVFKSDQQRNGITHNLCTCVYTRSQSALDSVSSNISSHLVKWNVGSHMINLFLEHQGMFIMREVMEQRSVELPNATSSNYVSVAEAQSEN